MPQPQRYMEDDRVFAVHEDIAGPTTVGVIREARSELGRPPFEYRVQWDGGNGEPGWVPEDALRPLEDGSGAA